MPGFAVQTSEAGQCDRGDQHQGHLHHHHHQGLLRGQVWRPQLHSAQPKLTARSACAQLWVCAYMRACTCHVWMNIINIQHYIDKGAWLHAAIAIHRCLVAPERDAHGTCCMCGWVCAPLFVGVMRLHLSPPLLCCAALWAARLPYLHVHAPAWMSYASDTSVYATGAGAARALRRR